MKEVTNQNKLFGAGNAEATDKANQFGQHADQVDADGKQANKESSKGKSFSG